MISYSSNKKQWAQPKLHRLKTKNEQSISADRANKFEIWNSLIRRRRRYTYSMASCCVCSSSGGSAFISRTSSQGKGFTFTSSSSPIRIAVIVPPTNRRVSRLRVRASMVDSSSDFARRIERAWLISQQPRPIVCSSCNSKGHIECKWCGGTGFFIIGDNMLCEVPSRNTSCVICSGKGSMCCSDCQGTGHRAKWLEQPPTS